ncbi:MAG: bifunctional 3-demethylubiquinol 3-O-methyltransferase/2-polyprenyl-6-hydroxyphenol methylase [Zetaproteobacteria bacterium CG2_30_46_52]|nr:MAG: bifunctional 3-demethylubiquinol 3-O-methyltransferase/2-polyprenyl-6-hydroxyphenol methylase [Zetaproteobacteria bacterium CG2_30_46_52]
MTSIYVDADEISRFEAIAAEWWDPNGRFKPLHQINPLRLDYIAQRIDLSQAKVLDVGCGGGLLAEGMAKRGADVTGVDRSPKALNVARLHAEQANVSVDYQENDAETWALTHAETYDAVTCLEVLEHVPDVPRAIAACASMLKPGGLFFFATLNRTPISYIKAIIGAEYVMGWLPKGTHQYNKFIKPNEMIRAVRQAGLNEQDIQGMSYALLSGHFYLSHDLSVNYLGFAKKPD